MQELINFTFVPYKGVIMYILAISLVMGMVAALLFLNIYFRLKVIKLYQYLQEQHIEFDAAHLINRRRLRAEILPKYPESQKQILTFANYIHYSMRMAAAIVFLITLFGFIVIYFSRYAD